MCDCYGHKCFVCGKLIPMHLGDFNTPRKDVAVFHEECFKRAHQIHLGHEFYSDGQRVVVVSLTEVALANQDDNHPNF